MFSAVRIPTPQKQGSGHSKRCQSRFPALQRPERADTDMRRLSWRSLMQGVLMIPSLFLHRQIPAVAAVARRSILNIICHRTSSFRKRWLAPTGPRPE